MSGYGKPQGMGEFGGKARARCGGRKDAAGVARLNDATQAAAQFRGYAFELYELGERMYVALAMLKCEDARLMKAAREMFEEGKSNGV